MSFVLQPVLCRAGGCCENGGSDGPLELHHLHYLAFNWERPSDLAPLCHERRYLYAGEFFPDPPARPDMQDERRRLEEKYRHLKVAA